MSIGLQPSAEAIADGTIDDSNPTHKRVEPKNTDIDDSVAKLGREEGEKINMIRRGIVDRL